MEENFQERVEKQFYVYIYKSLQNERSKYYWHKKRYESKETIVEQLEEQADEFAYTEKAFEYAGYLTLEKGMLGIKNSCLLNALVRLNENDKKVIVLAYFFDLTDSEIGKLFHKGRSTVAYWRVRALSLIKHHMEENGDEW